MTRRPGHRGRAAPRGNPGSRGTPRTKRVRDDGTKREVTLADYERMVALYAEFGMMSAITTATTWSYATVKRYVDHGDPARGWPSIRERVAKMQADARAKADAATVDSLAAVHMRVRAAARVLQGIIETQLRYATRVATEFQRLGDDPPAGKAEAEAWREHRRVLLGEMRELKIKDVADTGRFALFAHGGADGRLDVAAPAADDLSQKSDDELRAIVAAEHEAQRRAGEAGGGGAASGDAPGHDRAHHDDDGERAP